MKYHTIVTILGLFIFGLMVTAFQCGSAEMTSAKLYIQRSDWDNAEKSLAKEVAKNPTNAEAWYLLGQARMQKNNFQGMVEAFDGSLKASKEFEKNINDAKKYAWGQSLNQGVNLFNKSIKASKDSATALRQEAVKNYKLAISINPDSTVAYQNLAIAYHSEAQYDDEIATVKEALKRKQTPLLHTSLINAYLQKAQIAEAASDKQAANENYNSAIAAITDARKLEPNNAELLGTMIDLYVRLGRASEAKPLIREAVDKDPANKIYQYNLGVILLQTDSLQEAVSHFEEALKSDPVYDVALQNIGVAHMKLGDRLKKASQGPDAKSSTDKSFLEHFKKAADYFERLVEIKKDDPNYWDFLASAYANANMIKKAEAAIKKAEELRKK